ncbi:MAG: hypothetical protein DME16_21095 [Candidatus Rokuibacteriota bacterium]|nr:MAG: hypothetical protein DME16_21095 [Candidatus Rokubacteria bacterium]
MSQPISESIEDRGTNRKWYTMTRVIFLREKILWALPTMFVLAQCLIGNHDKQRYSIHRNLCGQPINLEDLL